MPARNCSRHCHHFGSIAAYDPYGFIYRSSCSRHSAILLDARVSANLVLGQRAIFSLNPEFRTRLNGLFMAIFFFAGAIGSSIEGWIYSTGGWSAALWIGMTFPIAAILYFATEKK